MSDRQVIRAYENMLRAKELELSRAADRMSAMRMETEAWKQQVRERDELLRLYKETIERQEQALRLLRLRERVS